MHVNPRFPLDPGTPVRPFVIAGPSVSTLGLPSAIRVVDALDADSAPFCAAMNRANCLAYDGSMKPGTKPSALGMPPWVMLDCCLLPSGVFGYEAPRDALPERLADLLDPEGALEWIGVSEYIAIPSVKPGEFVGVSLFSLAIGAGLGTRTKALALGALGARTQVGVTQWASAGVALHLRFGRLRVISAEVAIHNRPLETFVYAVDVPDAAGLERVARGESLSQLPDIEADLVLDPRRTDVRAALKGVAGPVFVVSAGDVVDGALSSISFAFSNA